MRVSIATLSSNSMVLLARLIERTCESAGCRRHAWRPWAECCRCFHARFGMALCGRRNPGQWQQPFVLLRDVPSMFIEHVSSAVLASC